MTTDSDRSGNRSGSRARRSSRNAWSAGALGASGSGSPSSRASARMRSQRSGWRRTRRSEGKPRASRNCAVAVFAAIMKSWIISFERFSSSGRRSARRSPSKTTFDSAEREGEGAALLAAVLHRPGDCVLQAQLPLDLPRGGHRRGRGRLPVEPRRDGVVGQPGLVPHEGAGDRRAVDRAVPAGGERDHDGQPVLVLVERGEVGREPLGQHREHLRRRVDGGGVRPRALVDRAAARDRRVDVGHRDEEAHRAVGKLLGHRQLVEVARVVVVDRDPGEGAQVLDAPVGPGRWPGDRLRLGDDGGREVGLEAARPHGAARDVPEPLASAGGTGCHPPILPRPGVGGQPGRTAAARRRRR